MIHDAGAGGEDDVAELTRRQQLDDPLLEIPKLDIVARRDHTSLVETAVELDDNLAGAVIVNFFELANVACTERLSVDARRACCDRINIKPTRQKESKCVRSIAERVQSLGYLKGKGRRSNFETTA